MSSKSVIMFAVSRFIDDDWELFGLYPDKETADKIKKELEKEWRCPAQVVPNRITFAVNCEPPTA